MPNKHLRGIADPARAEREEKGIEMDCEITSFLCNNCWKPVVAPPHRTSSTDGAATHGIAFKTRCFHILCAPCANALMHMSQGDGVVPCPVCKAALTVSGRQRGGSSSEASGDLLPLSLGGRSQIGTR